MDRGLYQKNTKRKQKNERTKIKVSEVFNRKGKIFSYQSDRVVQHFQQILYYEIKSDFMKITWSCEFELFASHVDN